MSFNNDPQPPILELPCLSVEPYQAKEAIECVIHTILFTRALNVVNPEDVVSDRFDVRYHNSFQ